MAQTKVIKAKTYVQLLQERDDTKGTDYTFQNEENKLQFQADLLATQRDLSKEKQNLSKLMCKDTLSAQRIMETQDEIAALQSGVTRLQGLIKELFNA